MLYEDIETNEMTRCSSLLDRINDDAIWTEFLIHKTSNEFDDSNHQFLLDMYQDEECRSICSSISRGDYEFSIPHKKLISKNRFGKKRTVYQFESREMVALKIIAYLIYDYDYLFSTNLYSFRRNVSVKNAIDKLFSVDHLDMMWGYKADIHNYFNSIDVTKLLPELREDLSDDRLFHVFETILLNPHVVYNGEVITEEKGVMAGIPLSAFLANYYLRDVDAYFDSQECIYMRYADDILILADSEENILNIRKSLIEMITQKGLEMNPDKERFFKPGDSFEFLGFTISKDCVDISYNTVRKMKGKIRRSARSIRRWMLDKQAPVEGTIRALIRQYNHRFYGYESGDFSWASWYFSSITTTESLHEIDRYFQDWARYVATGRHNKKNYSIVPYEMLKSCGYTPLVSEYYNQRRLNKP